MKKLLLIRHAQAEKYSETNQDIDRKLTSGGMKKASLLGKYLNDEGIKPDLIICSMAQRSQLTAELIASQSNYQLNDIQCLDGLYEASIRTFIGLLSQLDNSNEVVAVIGHNPTITFTADYFCDTEVNGMEPGAMIQVKFEVANWSGLSKGIGRCTNQFDLPSQD